MVLLIRTVLRLSENLIWLASCYFLYLHLAQVCRVWRSLVESVVRPLRVVEVNPIVDDLFGLKAIDNLVRNQAVSKFSSYSRPKVR